MAFFEQVNCGNRGYLHRMAMSVWYIPLEKGFEVLISYYM
jgi:hypothetical protein